MSQGYKMGEMDKYRIERKNVAHGFTPDNCYFTLEPPKYIEPVEITQGASKVEYKSTYRLKKRRPVPIDERFDVERARGA